jgi:prepilin-type N-terminal cleavage/methylation domain-containing protein
MLQEPNKNKGFSLIEVIAVSAILVFVFGGLFSAFEYSLKLINNSRAKLTAISVANDRMEYFRSLPYASVGTVSGFPVGTIPQNNTITMNGIDFAERVIVDYVDDPGDGQVTATTTDSNNISTDYKRIRVDYTWEIAGATSSIFMVSNIIPRSIETSSGGGTVRINVIDENSQLLPGASVRISNAGSGYDVTKVTDVTGVALFSVLANSNYEVEVTGPINGNNYSIDGTYVATTSNPNPVVSAFSVLEADISTLTFQIGELSDLTVKTLSSVMEDDVREEFTDLAGVASSSDVDIYSGQLVLAGSPNYAIRGVVYLMPIEPVTILRWETIAVGADLPLNTSYKVRVSTGTSSGPFTLIPEIDLPGNSVGFSDSLIDISGLDPVVYPSLVVELVLETTDNNFTPLIDEVGVYYRESETPSPNTSLTMIGNKTIGSDIVFTPIHKFNLATSTDVAGELYLPEIEFDIYNLTTPGFDVAVGCPAHPFTLHAGVDGELELFLTANQTNTLRVAVLDTLARAIPGAEVILSRSGFSATEYTNSCGQVFFNSGVASEADYTVAISAPGYTTTNITPYVISNDSLLSVTLNP